MPLAWRFAAALVVGVAFACCQLVSATITTNTASSSSSSSSASSGSSTTTHQHSGIPLASDLGGRAPDPRLYNFFFEPKDSVPTGMPTSSVSPSAAPSSAAASVAVSDEAHVLAAAMQAAAIQNASTPWAAEQNQALLGMNMTEFSQRNATLALEFNETLRLAMEHSHSQMLIMAQLHRARLSAGIMVRFHLSLFLCFSVSLFLCLSVSLSLCLSVSLSLSRVREHARKHFWLFYRTSICRSLIIL
jgi:hypothetical protein